MAIYQCYGLVISSEETPSVTVCLAYTVDGDGSWTILSLSQQVSSPLQFWDEINTRKWNFNVLNPFELLLKGWLMMTELSGRWWGGGRCSLLRVHPWHHLYKDLRDLLL